jgi:hypothetical protein
MKITNLFSGLALIIFAFSFVIPSADAAGEVVTVKHSKAKSAGKIRRQTGLRQQVSGWQRAGRRVPSPAD